VIVGPQLAELLRRHLASMGATAPDTPLFSGARGDGLRWNNYFPRPLRPATDSAALRWAAVERRRLIGEGWSRIEATAHVRREAARLRQLTPHHLRRTAAALLWAAGASDIEVQVILGHADIATSRRLYGHLLAGSEQAAAVGVEQLRQARRVS
jgi:integrase